MCDGTEYICTYQTWATEACDHAYVHQASTQARTSGKHACTSKRSKTVQSEALKFTRKTNSKAQQCTESQTQQVEAPPLRWGLGERGRPGGGGGMKGGVAKKSSAISCQNVMRKQKRLKPKQPKVRLVNYHVCSLLYQTTKMIPGSIRIFP